MSSSSDAELHIREIHQEYSVDGHDKLADLVRNSLEILSTELYDRSTHFVLELLQNADDNQYDCEVPSLKFTLKEGYLRVDCNEIGFTPENVDAICTIRGSTKKDRDLSNGFTGEKGIGFKSVFKAAEVVWIASKKYRFKFDKREKFGIIAPVWEQFPGAVDPSHTSMYLQLSGDYVDDQVMSALQAFDAGLMLFLRRLKHIDLEVSLEDSRVWTQSIRRSEKFDERGHNFIELKFGSTKRRYQTFGHCVNDLPNEAKRPNRRTSDLVLGFPLEAANEGTSQTFYVYSGLPIADYGLNFLLNADFLLTASRLQIDTSRPWNQAIRDGVAEAFLEAVPQFNEGPLRYSWPLFVPSAHCSDFFLPTKDIVMDQLRASSILECMEGSLVKGCEVSYVDLALFADAEDIPFTLSKATAKRYLSPRYQEPVIDPLCELGVSRMTDVQFLSDLKGMICADPEAFHNRPEKWHEQLAKALWRFAGHYKYGELLRKLEIVPLINGKWVSADQNPVFIGNDALIDDWQQRTATEDSEVADGLASEVGTSTPSTSVPYSSRHQKTSLQSSSRKISSDWSLLSDTDLPSSWYSPSFRDPCGSFDTNDASYGIASIQQRLRDLHFLEDTSPSLTGTTQAHLNSAYFTDFFSRNSRLVSAPAAKHMLFVDTRAGASRDRHQLFSLMGIKVSDERQICQLICDLHASDDFEPERWPRSELISHAAFLYKSNWVPKKGTDLWYATAADQRCKGSRLYLLENTSDGTALGRVLGKIQARLLLLHDDYLNSLPDAEEWKMYLTRTLGISSIPRLAHVPDWSRPRFGELTTEFKEILVECHASDVFQVVSDHWHA